MDVGTTQQGQVTFGEKNKTKQRQQQLNKHLTGNTGNWDCIPLSPFPMLLQPGYEVTVDERRIHGGLNAIITVTNMWALDMLSDTFCLSPHWTLKRILAELAFISPILQIGNWGSDKTSGCWLCQSGDVNLIPKDTLLVLPPSPFSEGSRPQIHPEMLATACPAVKANKPHTPPPNMSWALEGRGSRPCFTPCKPHVLPLSYWFLSFSREPLCFLHHTHVLLPITPSIPVPFPWHYFYVFTVQKVRLLTKTHTI